MSAGRRHRDVIKRMQTMYGMVQSRLGRNIKILLADHSLDSEPLPFGQLASFFTIIMTNCEDKNCLQGAFRKNESEQLLRVARQPCYDISAATVLFGANDHSGTKKMVEIVEAIACDLERYDEWQDTIVDDVKRELAKVGCNRFLVFLTTEGHQPCVDIREGFWFIATEAEVRENIKRIFFDTLSLD